jgi:hypothetical protein
LAVILQDVPILNQQLQTVAETDTDLQMCYVKKSNCTTSKSLSFYYYYNFIKKLKEINNNFREIQSEDNFCNDEKCYQEFGNLPIYRNPGHTSGSFSATMGEWMTEQIRDLG